MSWYFHKEVTSQIFNVNFLKIKTQLLKANYFQKLSRYVLCGKQNTIFFLLFYIAHFIKDSV